MARLSATQAVGFGSARPLGDGAIKQREVVRMSKTQSCTLKERPRLLNSQRLLESVNQHDLNKINKVALRREKMAWSRRDGGNKESESKRGEMAAETWKKVDRNSSDPPLHGS